eukprot:685380-Hanusia_phi.AAC.3
MVSARMFRCFSSSSSAARSLPCSSSTTPGVLCCPAPHSPLLLSSFPPSSSSPLLHSSLHSSVLCCPRSLHLRCTTGAAEGCQAWRPADGDCAACRVLLGGRQPAGGESRESDGRLRGGRGARAALRLQPGPRGHPPPPRRRR